MKHSFIKKCLGAHTTPFINFDLNPKEYYTNKFVIGFDFEKISDEGRFFSGYSTKRGEHLQLQMKGLKDVTDVYILINHTTVLKLYDMGADVEE